MSLHILHDARYAARAMIKARGVTLVALVTIALGIGANTAIFSVVDATLLTPLPYADPDRLVMVWQDMRARGGPATEWTGPAQHFEWKRETSVFEGVTSIRGWNATVSGDAEPESLAGEQTTYEYFDVLGARPEIGRAFRQSDDIPSAPRVVVLSHGLWVNRFGRDASILGRRLTINGEAHDVIGVMPASFRPALVTGAKLWRPMRLNAVNPARNVAVFHTIGRLRRDITLAQARAALDTLAQRLERVFPESDSRKGINPVPLQEQQVGGVRRPLFVLLGAVGFVLLIACVNIANLLLARASGRVREFAVRRALGADRLRIVRQLLTESVLLGLSGGALGLLAGIWGINGLKAIAPRATPRIDEVGLDRRVLAFALGLSLLTGVLFGLVPAWHAVRDRFDAALTHGARGPAGESGGRVRRSLIVGELALALMLLVGSGLLIRTFLALERADLGFNADHVLTGFVLPPPVSYRNDDQRRTLYDALLEQAAALPGVREAALSSVIPLNGDSDTSIEIDGQPRPPRSADAPTVWYRLVSANYFDVMGIPLRRGRVMRDREPAPVAVINETMARRHWPHEDPIGRRIRFAPEQPWCTIVGVVGDVEVRGPLQPHVVEAYVGYWLNPELGTNVVLKTSLDPAALAEPLRHAVSKVDPRIAIANVASMDAIVGDSIVAQRFYATLVTIFAGLALALAAVGIYGVLSYAVALRTSEIGVRLALGAAERQIFALIVGESVTLAIMGLAIGVAGSLAVGRGLQSLLYGVASTDPATFAATALLLLLVAFVASYIPARRAMRVNPVTALRAE